MHHISIFFSPHTYLLVNRLISENFVEIHSKLPEISHTLEWGELSKEAVTYFNIFLHDTHHPS